MKQRERALHRRSDMPSTVSLLVVRVVRSDERALVIDGRCATGTVSRGNVFHRVVEAHPVAHEGEMRTHSTHERAVQLKVTALEAYEKDWKSLEAGMTARVTFAGEGGCCVRDGDVLQEIVALE
jgi:hypothetical protein